MKKAQTATEYLVLVAVVIIISLIVVGVLGGIPNIGSGADKANQQIFQTATVAITDVSVGPYYTLLTVRNNKGVPVTVNNMSIGGVDCYFESTPLIASYKEKEMYCYGVVNVTPNSFAHAVELNYTDSQISAVQMVDFNDVNLVTTPAVTQASGQTITLTIIDGARTDHWFTIHSGTFNLSDVVSPKVVDGDQLFHFSNTTPTITVPAPESFVISTDTWYNNIGFAESNDTVVWNYFVIRKSAAGSATTWTMPQGVQYWGATPENPSVHPWLFKPS